jgi:hypothetical protein
MYRVLGLLCTAILSGLFDPRYPYPSLVPKGYELCTGNRLVVKDQRRFPKDLYTFVYVWLCGQEMETAFYCHSHFFCCSKSLLCSLLQIPLDLFFPQQGQTEQKAGLTVQKKAIKHGCLGIGFGVHFTRALYY